MSCCSTLAGPPCLNDTFVDAAVKSMLSTTGREEPRVELFPKEPQTVTEGGSAMFQCRVVQGIPEPRLQWSRVDGRPMTRQLDQLAGGVLRLVYMLLYV